MMRGAFLPTDGTSWRLWSAVRAGTAALVLLLTGAWAPAEQQPGRSFLWRVRSPSTTLYLVGSVHLMKPDAYPLSPAIERAFGASQVVAFEVDLDRMTAAAFQLLAEGTLPEDETLRDVVSEDTYQMVSRKLEELGLDIEGFQKMRPWLLAVTLTTFELTSAGYAQTQGIDMHLFERAKQTGKTTMGLETVEYQIRLFAELGAHQDEQFLRHTLLELDAVIPEIDALMDHWKNGDVAEVERLLTEAYQEFPELFDRLVAGRNRNWLPQLEELLAGGEPAMAVVGALHLVGNDGLISQLRARGYRVEQL
jgi:uncharacterized protein YbaP (TraB family)